MQSFISEKYGKYFAFKLSIIPDDWSYNADGERLSYENEFASGTHRLDASLEAPDGSVNFAIVPQNCKSISFADVSPEVARSLKDIGYRIANNFDPAIFAVGQIDASKTGYTPSEKATIFNLQDGGFESVPGVKVMATEASYGLGPSLNLAVDFDVARYILVDSNSGKVLAQSTC